MVSEWIVENNQALINTCFGFICVSEVWSLESGVGGLELIGGR